MIKEVTNYQPGPRGINLEGGSTVWVESGQTIDLSGLKVKGDLPDFGKPSGQADRDADELELLRAENAELKAKLAALDLDGNGAPGGSRAASPVSLSNKTKAELLDIAKAEGVEVEDNATNDDIKSAIELHREG